MQKHLYPRWKVAFTCLLFICLSIFSTANFAKEKQGGVNGGGANRTEGLFNEAKTNLLMMVAKNKDQVLDEKEVKSLSLDISDSPLIMNFSESDVEFSTQRKANAPIVIYVKKLNVEESAQSSMNIYSLLIEAYSMHFTNEADIKSKLQKLVDLNIPLPELFNFNNVQMLSINDGQLNTCRNQISLIGNPFSGEVYLEARSSGKCTLKNREESIRLTRNHYKCSKNDDGAILCVTPAKQSSSDLDDCLRGALKDSDEKNFANLLILKDNSIKAHFFWCDLVGDTVYKGSIDKTYVRGNKE